MSVLLQAELLKLRTTRTFVALVAVALAISVVLCVLIATLTDDIAPVDARGLITFDFSGFFILLLGIIGMTGEWRHKTITGSVLAAPDRLKLLVAKVLAFAAAGVVLSFIVTVSLMLVSSIILSSRGFETVPVSDLIDVLWRNLLVAALMGALGVCIGALVRNQIVAVIIAVALVLIVEPTLFALAPDVAKFGPTQGAPAGIVEPPTDDGSGEDIELLAPGLAIAVVLGWIGLVFAFAAARLQRSDLV